MYVTVKPLANEYTELLVCFPFRGEVKIAELCDLNWLDSLAPGAFLSKGWLSASPGGHFSRGNTIVPLGEAIGYSCVV